MKEEKGEGVEDGLAKRSVETVVGGTVKGEKEDGSSGGRGRGRGGGGREKG